ncbi:MAG TPA: OmpH family outer membrane protein [Candidatus Baltobacteraceae bacterium]|jgi:outer membrane protein|nr:OmpH family outer membrane protein [Candidatus Baltobacteraceae bacterium]
MRTRLLHTLLVTAALATIVAPAAIAADLTDVGFLDQSAVGSLPQFARANAQLAQYKSQLDSQFNAAMRGAKSDADKQRVSMQFQQQFADKQRELVGPLFQRAQLAIAQVAGTKNLSVIVDKRIIVYGGQDVTKDVVSALSSSQAIAPPSASPAPSEIGFVDQAALDDSDKVKSAASVMQKYQADQQKIFAPKLQAAKSDSDKQAVVADYNKAVQAKRDELLKPLVDQTRSVTGDVAKKRNLLLVIDRADIIFGGTDITKDVQDSLK